jgi:hypothetical protein
MARGRLYLVAPLVALGLFGCRAINYEERAPWRAQAEEQCISQRLVQASAFVEPVAEINGNYSCGMNHPLKVLAASEGQVTIKPQATLGCPMTVAFNRWVEEIAQPAAQAWFGEQIVEVRQLSSYSCRRIGGSGNMSEHGFGNALDVAGFTFASGRIVTVKHGWNGSPEERGFLRQIHAGGCEVFTTVLGPGYDAAHHDHFHFDLARRNSVVCRPTPQLISPPRRYPNDPGPVPMVQKQQKHYERFPVARVERPQEQPQQRQQSLYENSDVPPQRFVPRAKQQPLPPDQAYPPAPQQARQQPNPQPNQQPLAISPQQQPQYMQAPSAPSPNQPQYSQPYPQQQPQMRWQQGPQPDPNYRPSPEPYNPNRLVPPARVGAKKNADEILTGSIPQRKYYKDVPPTKKDAPKAIPGED